MSFQRCVRSALAVRADADELYAAERTGEACTSPSDAAAAAKSCNRTKHPRCVGVNDSSRHLKEPVMDPITFAFGQFVFTVLWVLLTGQPVVM